MAWLRFPSEMQTTGVDAGVLSLPTVKEQIEKALEPFNLAKPAIVRMAGNDIYFAAGRVRPAETESRRQWRPRSMRRDGAGVAAVFRADEVWAGTNSTLSEIRTAFELSYFAGRSGDLFVLQKPYWLTGSFGRGHGAAYRYGPRHSL